MSDQPMRDEQDALLTRLFAEQEQPLHTPDFMKPLVGRLELEQRKQRAYSIAVVSAILGLGAVIAPWIVQVTSALVGLGDAITDAIGVVLASPIAWLVGGALAVTFLPVVYVWRTLRN